MDATVIRTGDDAASALPTRSGEIPDPLARWLVCAEALTGPAAGTGEVGDEDRASRPVRAALDELEPATQRVLVLRDGYDLPERTVAAVLGVEVGTARRRLAAARLALLTAYDGRPAPSPGDGPDCPTDFAVFAAVADGTLEAAQAACLRRHAYRCPRCEDVIDVEVRARRMVAALPTATLSVAARQALVAAARGAASDVAPGVRRRAASRRFAVPPAVAGLTAAVALVAGVGAGLIDGRAARPGGLTVVSDVHPHRSPAPTHTDPPTNEAAARGGWPSDPPR
jgi:hypothetical protein